MQKEFVICMWIKAADIGKAVEIAVDAKTQYQLPAMRLKRCWFTSPLPQPSTTGCCSFTECNVGRMSEAAIF